MEEEKITRQDVHILSRNSNWAEDSVRETLVSSEIYASKSSWTNLLRYTLLGTGIAFTLVGIIFFFAFNWNELHKFVKLGMIEALLIASVSLVLFNKRMDEKIKNFILAGASVLVGVLFAVYGQIYQTGANAYDFFLGWTLSIALWALFSGFPVLWFIFLLLCNTTMVLYEQQVAVNWSKPYLYNVLFLINALFIVLMEFVYNRKLVKDKLRWLISVTSLAATTIITTLICIGIFDNGSENAFTLSVVLALVFFALAVWYGYTHRQLIYLALVPFAVMIIIIALIIQPLREPIGAFLVISVFIIAVTTLLITQLVKLNKRWHDTKIED